jgi:hypothetical protein
MKRRQEWLDKQWDQNELLPPNRNDSAGRTGKKTAASPSEASSAPPVDIAP